MRLRKLFKRSAWCLLPLLLAAEQLFAKSSINMTRGVTPISRDTYDLHMTIFYICCAIGVLVFGVLIYSLIFHRKSKHPVPATFHESTTVEIIWAVIPFIILVLMAIPATKVLIAAYDVGKADLTIKVTAFQWKWKYDYLDNGVSFFSNLATPIDQIHNKAPKDKWYLLNVDHPLVLPTGTKIRFLITSNDVIHAWWVPALGIKKDAVPGFIHENWARIDKPGTYRGQCAELCGVNHGFMPIVVKAVSPEKFQQWLVVQRKKEAASAKEVDKTLSKEKLIALGKKRYDTDCSACHKSTGEGIPPLFPALKGSKITTGGVKGHIQMVIEGVPGTAMQAFGAQLSDLDIAAIVTYERNAWGNNNQAKYGKQAGGIVQPADVKKLRPAGDN